MDPSGNHTGSPAWVGDMSVGLRTVHSENDTRDLWKCAHEQLADEDRTQLKKLTADPNTRRGDLNLYITDAIEALQKKHDLCHSTWTIKLRHSREKNLREFVGDAMGWIEKFLGVGDSIMQLDPTHLALPWAAIRFIVTLSTSDYQESRDLLGIVGKIVSVAYRCREYENLYLTQQDGGGDIQYEMPSSVNGLRGAIINLYKHILIILAAYHYRFDRPKPGRAVAAVFNPRRAGRFLDTLEELEEEVIKHAQNCDMLVTQEMKRDVEAMSRRLNRLADFGAPICHIQEGVARLLDNDEKRHWWDILNWTSSLQVGSWHDNVVNRRTPGTCEWLLEHQKFKQWRQISTSSVFWLWGLGGSGKTFLASKVVDELRPRNEDENEAFAYFYCRSYEHPWDEAVAILRSIFRQLATRIQCAVPAQQSLMRLHHECMHRQGEPSLQSIAEKLLEFVDSFDRTTIILDGYQEVSTHLNGRSELLKALLDLALYSSTTVKLLITRRRDIGRPVIGDDDFSVDVTVEAVHSDISSYVNAETKKHAHWPSWSEDLRQRICETLTDMDKHQGVFQWIAFSVRNLERCILSEDAEQFLQDLPSRLTDLYDETWRKIEREGQASYDYSLRNDYKPAVKDRYKLPLKIIQWVSCSPVPMGMRELLFAVHQDSSSARQPRKIEENLNNSSIDSLMKGLLVWDPSSEGWRFAHFTIAEHFIIKYATICNTRLTSRMAANLCLKTLTWKWGDSEDESGRAVQDDEAFEAFHEYAKWCWPTFMQRISAPSGPDMTVPSKLPHTSVINSFFGKPHAAAAPYRTWVDSLTTAADLAPHRYRCLQISKPSTELLSPGEYPAFGLCIFGIRQPLEEWLGDDLQLDVDARNTGNWSLLSLAIHHQHQQICELLLAKGACCHEPDGSYCGSPLATAASVSPEATRSILDYDVDPNLCFEVEILGLGGKFHIGYGTPLAAAAMEGEVECIDLLLRAGADVNHPSKARGYPGSPLAIAAWRGNTLAVNRLLEAEGIDVHMQLLSGPSGKNLYGSALAAASVGGHVGTVRALLARMGPDDINRPLPTSVFGSALAAAAGAWRTNLDVLGLLVDGGADVNAPLPCGYGSALAAAAYAVKEDPDGTFGEELRHFRHEMALDDAPFHVVVAAVYESPLATKLRTHRGDAAVVQELLYRGARVSMPLDGSGLFTNALHAAQESGNPEVIQIMTEWLSMEE